MMREKKPAVLSPQDEAAALMYLRATMHYPKEVRESGDLEAEREHLRRITPETLKGDLDNIQTAVRKLALLKESNSQGTIKHMAGLWRETHPKK